MNAISVSLHQNMQNAVDPNSGSQMTNCMRSFAEWIRIDKVLVVLSISPAISLFRDRKQMEKKRHPK